MTSPYDATKIHIGPGRLVLTEIKEGATAVNCGFTKDGGILKFVQQVEKIETDQLLGPAGFYISGEECEFETLLAELEMEQLNIALGGGGTVSDVTAGVGQPGGKKLEFGENAAVKEYVLTYTAPKRTNRALNVVAHLYITKVHPDASLTFTKNGQLAYKVRFVARPDLTKGAGKQLGYIMDETAVATS
ncbi:MAG: hypothetical protein ACYDDN_03800 [Candidatus Desulforudaceae bacterium]